MKVICRKAVAISCWSDQRNGSVDLSSLATVIGGSGPAMTTHGSLDPISKKS
jgi:hypothetical protein